MHKSCLASRKCYCVSSGYHQLPGVGSEEGCGPVALGLSKVSLSGLETNQKLELLLSDRALDYYVWDPTFDLYTEKKKCRDFKLRPLSLGDILERLSQWANIRDKKTNCPYSWDDYIYLSRSTWMHKLIGNKTSFSDSREDLWWGWCKGKKEKKVFFFFRLLQKIDLFSSISILLKEGHPDSPH